MNGVKKQQVMIESEVKDRSYAFALKVIKAYKSLSAEQREFVLSNQLLRSGTSIGAMIMEADKAQSENAFREKLDNALKEANDTEFWLMILKDSEYLDVDSFNDLAYDCKDLVARLGEIVRASGEPRRSR
jgi:four helix bundle protein